jgi:hypothetical protein
MTREESRGERLRTNIAAYTLFQEASRYSRKQALIFLATAVSESRALMDREIEAYSSGRDRPYVYHFSESELGLAENLKKLYRPSIAIANHVKCTIVNLPPRVTSDELMLAAVTTFEVFRQRCSPEDLESIA